jgi:hypothetical protein
LVVLSLEIWMHGGPALVRVDGLDRCADVDTLADSLALTAAGAVIVDSGT